MLSIHHLKLNGLEILNDGESIGDRSLDNHDERQEPVPGQCGMESGMPPEPCLPPDQRQDVPECGVATRIRRVASGWLYEYYHEEADTVDCSVFVPYADTDRVSDQSPEKKKSFMYRIEMNRFTTLNQAMAGFAERSDIRVRVRRVPGGWIYEYYNVKEDQMMSAVFSPQNNQMQAEHATRSQSQVGQRHGDQRRPGQNPGRRSWSRRPDGKAPYRGADEPGRDVPYRNGNSKDEFDERGRPIPKLGGKAEIWKPGVKGV